MTLHPSAHIPSRSPGRSPIGWLALALLIAALATGLSGCSSKSDTDRASEAVQAGLVAQRAGNLDEAARLYREALGFNPQDKLAYYNLGLIDQLQGRPRDAETNYRLALTIDSDFSSALFNLAILRTGVDPQEAVGLYQHALRLEPNWAAAHFNLGLLLRTVGRQTDGDGEVRTALGLDPSLVDPASISPASPVPSPGLTPSAPASS
jgi:tetratricopeptide (TPR) repeat protein